MKINAISHNTVDATLTKNELVLLGNIMYEYEQQHASNDSEPLDDGFHELSAQIVTSRDICQYGHLDGHSLDVIIRHRLAMSKPGMEYAECRLTDVEKQILCSYLESNDIKTACGNQDFRSIIHKILGDFNPEGKLSEYMHTDHD